MSFQTKDTAGATVQLDNGDKVVLIDGRATVLYINNIVPIGVGMRNRARILMPVPVQVQKFTSLDANGVPQYAAAVTIKGQAEPQGVQRWDKEAGALVKLADEVICFTNTDTSQSSGVFKAELLDKYRGEMFTNAFEVTLITTSYTGADRNAGEPGIPTDIPTLITPLLVEVTAQYDYSGRESVKCGDAKLVVDRAVVTQAQLEGASRIMIQPKGRPALAYTLWSADGIRYPNTYQLEVFLKRLQR